LNSKYGILAAILLIALISVSLFLTFNKPSGQTVTTRTFYVGVEYAYGNQFNELKTLVDKVKDYTNLFVIGSPSLTFNRSALDESCNYLYSSGLNFIVLITSSQMYNDANGYPPNNNVFDWIGNATLKYGSQFLGIYRYDEPGGNQLDDGASRLINSNAGGYSEVANSYVGNLSTIINYYFAHSGAPGIFTSDYGLYYFDYASNYSTIFAEFVGNETRHTNQDRQQIISLARGAAESFHKDWGVIVTWAFNNAPYLENGTQLYSDLTLAYSAGATYAVVFNYPIYPDNNPYGALQDEHFSALQRFWIVIQTNPASIAQNQATVAYVVPKDYGYGFRGPNDTIWGLFPADTLTQKISLDIHTLLTKYYSNLNIIYNDPETIGPTLSNYTKVYYWNQTIT
jgi:hypothetical protein